MKMQYIISTFSVILILVIFYASSLLAQDEPKEEKNQIKNQVNSELKTIQHGRGFVDTNGDGFNDNAPDIDGDGIPNGQDPDFVRPQDGTGQMKMNGWNWRSMFGGYRYGPGNGTGNNGICPRNGTGYGAGNGTGRGICDGTGPKGYRGGRK